MSGVGLSGPSERVSLVFPSSGDLSERRRGQRVSVTDTGPHDRRRHLSPVVIGRDSSIGRVSEGGSSAHHRSSVSARGRGLNEWLCVPDSSAGAPTSVSREDWYRKNCGRP